MPRLLLALLASALLLVPTAADGATSSGARVRGVVTAKDAVRSFVTVSSPRLAHVLRVPPGSFERIRLGRRVELRGSTLRSRGRGPTRVLARDVILVRSEPRAHAPAPEPDDDEVELRGRITSLSPLTVSNGTRSVTCAVPAGMSLAGFAVGDVVEITCDLVGGVWTLRRLKLEDELEDEVEVDDEVELKGVITSLSPLTVSQGGRAVACVVPAGVPLGGFAVGDFVEIECDLQGGVFVLRELEHEDDDDDHSGPGGGDDDDDDDRSGPGGGDD
jgi:hypothetical protein